MVPVMDDLLPGMLDLARDGGETLTRQLTDQLRALITGGRLAPGQRLPSSRHLAQSLDVSRNTVSFAIEQLAAEGYLTQSAGRRPAVAEGLALDRRKVSSRTSAGDRVNLSPWARDLQRSIWPPIHKGRPRPFQPGLADEREFPHDLWSRCLRRAARNALSRRDRSINHPPLQEALLAHLSVHRGIKAKPQQILIVPTAQAGIALVAAALLEPGDHAWAESPGYGGAYVAFKAAGAIVSAMPLDEQGMTIGSRKDVPRVIFVTPSHQYPTGRLMPIGRRLELLRYAEAVGACIIEDDYDGEFHYEARPVAALQGLAPSPRIFYLGTFSKATYADIRLGYVVVPEAQVDTLRTGAAPHGNADIDRDAGCAGRIHQRRRLSRSHQKDDAALQGTPRPHAAGACQRSRQSAYRRGPGRGHAIAGAGVTARATIKNWRHGCSKPMSSAARCRS